MSILIAITARQSNILLIIAMIPTSSRSMTGRLPPGPNIYLCIEVDGQETATFFYGPDGKQWTRLGDSIYFGDSWKDLRNMAVAGKISGQVAYFFL